MMRSVQPPLPDKASQKRVGKDLPERAAFAAFGHPPFTPVAAQVAPDAAFPAPGHCSVLAARDGATAIVYHAHLASGGPQRHVMLDALAWVADGAGGEWPAMASGRPYPGVGEQRVP
jgi:hypothetical protein